MRGEQAVLVALLAVNAALVFGYRVYRLTKGGPTADAIGGALLAVILGAIAVGAGSGAGWAKWAALSYAILFALLVMPVWTLGVLIPLPPAGIDYAFAAAYWLSLVLIGIAAVLA
jgi:hypothetical protein